MKIRRTNEDFTAAIRRARVTVKVPKYIFVAETEIRVRIMSSART